MKTVQVHVMYKPSILDPQGKAIENTLDQLGYDAIEEVRMGKYFELRVREGLAEDELKEQIEAICDRLLANVVMENYHYEIVEEA